jgi:hypothetical protein
VSDPGNPSEVGLAYVSAAVGSIAFANDHVFAACSSGGLQVVDVSTPSSPQEVGSLETLDGAQDIAIVGDYAYVACGFNGLSICDISDPAHPSEVSRFATTSQALGVIARGNRVYIANGNDGLRILDVSDPADPQGVSVLDPGYWAHGIALSAEGASQSHAYVAGWDAGLRVVDISAPSSPVEVGSFETFTVARRIAIQGRYAFVAGDAGGLWILEDALVTATYLESFLAARENGHAVVRWRLSRLTDDRTLYLWRGEPGGGTQRISNESFSGMLSGEFVDPAPPTGEAEYWLQELGPDGSQQWYGPANLPAESSPALFPELCQNHPNPFNPRTVIRFTLPENTQVELAVYSVQGRRVAGLASGMLKRGTHEVVWEGCSDGGRSVPSGLYFYRLTTNAYTLTKRMLVIR